MKPILFNTEMVKAILDDRKTVTRRVVKKLETHNLDFLGFIVASGNKKEVGNAHFSKNNFSQEVIPPFEIDDILYVRETFHKDNLCTLYKASNYEDVDRYHGSDGFWHDVKWRPSIHMSREAARIFLKVTGVREVARH